MKDFNYWIDNFNFFGSNQYEMKENLFYCIFILNLQSNHARVYNFFKDIKTNMIANY